MKRLLTCDGKTHVHTLPFREIKTSIGAIAFTKGETYYLIGKCKWFWAVSFSSEKHSCILRNPTKWTV